MGRRQKTFSSIFNRAVLPSKKTSLAGQEDTTPKQKINQKNNPQYFDQKQHQKHLSLDLKKGHLKK